MLAQASPARPVVRLAFALSLGTACALACAIADPAAATTLNWKTAASGLASTGGNWTPSQVPTSADDAVFGLTGTYTVTWDALVTQVRSHDYKLGTVTLATTAAHTSLNDIQVGLANGDVATLDVGAANLATNGRLILGSGIGSTGTVNLLGVTSFLTSKSTSANVLVGSAGTGTLSLSGGALLTAGFGLAVGGSAGSHGTATVSGTSASPFTRSTLLLKSATGQLSVGSSGTGSLSVTSGGLVNVRGPLAIAPNAGASGTVSLSGALNGFSATLTDSSEIDVAQNAVAGVAAGTASVDVGSGSDLITTGPLRVGDPDGGTGTLSIEPGGVVACGSLVVNDAHGVFHFNGGVLDVTGGPFDPPGTVLDLNAATVATVNLLGGASAAFSNAAPAAYSLVVGDAGGGALNVNSGSTLSTNATVGLGAAAGSNGSLSVNGAGSSWSTPDSTTVVVGLGGTGTLSVTGAAQANPTIVDVAATAGSTGSVSVKGAGTLLTARSITVGGLGSTAGGTGSLAASLGAAVQTTGKGTTLTILAPGSILLALSSSITAANQVTCSGKLTMAGGTLTTGTLLLEPGNTFSGYGTVDAAIDAGAGSQVITASGGALALGSDASPNGFFNAGTLVVGSQLVTVHSVGTGTLGSVTMDTGTLTTTHGGAIPSGKTLSGRGTINGPLLNQGTITATNEGFTFNGILTNSGGTIGGTAIAFKGTGGFSGSGSLPVTTLTGDATTTVTATGALGIGTGAAGSTVALLGRLDCGANAVSFATIGLSGTTLGAVTSLNGGSLNSSIGFAVPANDSLIGVGTVNGLLTNNGIVAPGFSAGTLKCPNGYTQTSAGHLAMEIGNLGTDPFDKLIVGGQVTLAGTLDLRLLPGTVPQPGQNFAIVAASSRVGTFSAVTINGQPAGSQVTVNYGSGVTVHVNGITVDVPSDPAAGLARVELSAVSGGREEAYFELALPEAGHATLRLYDVRGRAAGTLVDGDLPAGRTRLPLRNAPVRVARGVYFGRATVTNSRGVEVRRARVVVAG